MAHAELCCGFYRGSIYLKEYGNATAGLLPVGNAEFSISQSTKEITQPNFQSLGGSACKIAFSDTLNLDLKLHCTSPENLAMAFLGTVTEATHAIVTDELHHVSVGGELIPLNFVPDKTQPITVTYGTTPTTATLGTHYVVTNAGILVIDAPANPLIGVNIKVTYTHGKNYVIDMQTVTPKTFYFVLDGFQVGDSSEVPVVLKVWKVKFSPAESFAFIAGEDFASIDLKGEILRDESVLVGSKFAKLEFGISNGPVI